MRSPGCILLLLALAMTVAALAGCRSDAGHPPALGVSAAQTRLQQQADAALRRVERPRALREEVQRRVASASKALGAGPARPDGPPAVGIAPGAARPAGQQLPSVTVGGVTTALPALALDHGLLALRFVARDPLDHELLEAYQDEPSFPAFLIRLRPRLLLGGQPLGGPAAGRGWPMGAEVPVVLTLPSSSGVRQLRWTVRAGSRWAVRIAGRPAGAHDLGTAHAALVAAASDADDRLDALLGGLGSLRLFARRQVRGRAAGAFEIAGDAGPTATATGVGLQVEELLGVPFAATVVGLRVAGLADGGTADEGGDPQGSTSGQGPGLSDALRPWRAETPRSAKLTPARLCALPRPGDLNEWAAEVALGLILAPAWAEGLGARPQQ